MPIEKRDPNSKAVIFIPTKQEKVTRSKARFLNEKIKSVEALEKRLQKKLDELDKR